MARSSRPFCVEVAISVVIGGLPGRAEIEEIFVRAALCCISRDKQVPPSNTPSLGNIATGSWACRTDETLAIAVPEDMHW